MLKTDELCEEDLEHVGTRSRNTASGQTSERDVPQTAMAHAVSC